MRHLIPVFCLLLAACTTHSAKNDADAVTPDGDVPVVDDAVEIESDDFILVEADEILSDGDALETDISETDTIDQENDPGSDADDSDAVYCVVDENPDADIIYIPNTHTGNELCPDLAIADFPYYDTDGMIHFCRQCDEVRGNDPQCVRNLWLDANEQLCTEKPQYDCWDYPCEMPWLRPTEPGEQPAPQAVPMHECDLHLNPQNPNGWLTGIATFKHFNLSEGKVGLYVYNMDTPSTDYYQNKRAFEYSINEKSYSVREGPAHSALSYYKGAYLIDMGNSAIGSDKTFLLYISSENDYRVVYNEPIYIATYTPALNDTWVFANINDGSTDHMMYAKIGEWQWTSLGNDTANEPYIVGDRLVFYDSYFRGIVCDLSLSPQSVGDCLIINRDQEDIRFPVPDEQNNDYIYFENTTVRDRIYKVDLGKEPWEYTELPLQEVEAATYQIPILQVHGNVLLYRNNFEVEGQYDSKLCYYRILEETSFCMKPMERTLYDGSYSPTKYAYGAAEFEGTHLVWQAWNDYFTAYRDMDCYCEKEGVCPFEE